MEFVVIASDAKGDALVIVIHGIGEPRELRVVRDLRKSIFNQSNE